MSTTIQIKRGGGAPPTLAAGEPAFDTTNHRLYLGDGAVNTIIGPVTGLAITPLTVNGVAITGSGTLATGTFTLTVTGTASIAGTHTGTHSGTSSGTNTGDQTITLTSDVTGSGTGSFAVTIANSAVTLAKMANMATASLIYRKTSGSGAPEVNTLATLKTDLSLTGINSGDQTSVSGNAGTATTLQTGRTLGMTGDVTWTSPSFNGSANVTAAGTIANDAVTYAKMQNVSAASVLLGRGSAAGSGDTQEIALGTGLSMSGTTLSSSAGGGDVYTDRTNTFLGPGTSGIIPIIVQAETGQYTDLSQWRDSAGTLVSSVNKTGGFAVAEGSNATGGLATLVGGTVTVTTNKVTANSRIQLTQQNVSGVSVATAVAVSSRSAGTSFTISSANVLDTSSIAWMIIEPA